MAEFDTLTTNYQWYERCKLYLDNIKKLGILNDKLPKILFDYSALLFNYDDKVEYQSILLRMTTDINIQITYVQNNQILKIKHLIWGTMLGSLCLGLSLVYYDETYKFVECTGVSFILGTMLSSFLMW